MDIRREDGAAMMMAMAATLLMTALGIAIVLATSSEAMIAANFRDASEAAYAADAAMERAVGDLAAANDWNSVLAGTVQSTFVDGLPTGRRTLATGAILDLDQVVNLANCGGVQLCSDADMDAITALRPWGANNPRWRLYSYGNFENMLPARAVDSSYYVLVMVADDSSETDGNPLQDGIGTAGEGSLALRGEAFGPRGLRRSVEATVARPAAGHPGLRVLSWREVR